MGHRRCHTGTLDAPVKQLQQNRGLRPSLGEENHLTDDYRVRYSLKPAPQLVDVKSRRLIGHLWSSQEEFLSCHPPSRVSS